MTCRLPWPETCIPTDPWDAARHLKGGEWGATLARKRPHRGADWSRTHIEAEGLSDRVPTVSAGEVTHVHRGDDGELGFIVEIRDNEGWYWTYAHLRSIDKSLSVGDHLDLGETFAVVGQSGSAASFDHLHLTLARIHGAWAGGTTYDPVAHIKARLATTSTAGNGSTPFEDDIMAELTDAKIQEIAAAVTTNLLNFELPDRNGYAARPIKDILRDAGNTTVTAVDRLLNYILPARLGYGPAPVKDALRDAGGSSVAALALLAGQVAAKIDTPTLVEALKDPAVQAELAKGSQTIVLAAIAALPAQIDAQLDDEQTELLAKIGQLPEAVRARISAALAS
ncbi:M23 family metallopeptidase [Glaciihabitans sp. dw_435]|uniref:M23 family metallopeptidase n=1 Tax=Glaciihabitans sp. dw_435 TaxID=2720081 RepID=UPI001BD23D70|nr:M23 family metallopeptidase [Glaciihabitans sp. dw_435]